MHRHWISALIVMTAVCCLLSTRSAGAGDEMTNPRARNFCFGWKFTKGDPSGAQQPDFDDSPWTDLSVPHDWSIEGPKDRDNPGGKRIGYFPTGIGWYRKHFQLAPENSDKKIFIEFEGIYRGSEVWINGHSLGKRPYGYTTFQHDLTPYVKFDGENVIAVRVDNQDQPSSRWYTGSGIYRPVHLIVTNTLYVKHWGTYVTTPKISDTQALVRIRTTVRNDDDQARDCTLRTRVLDAHGRVVAEQSAEQVISAGSDHHLEQDVIVPNPRLWSIENPNLYRIQTLIRDKNGVCDEYPTPLGIRDIRFDKDRGFLLNGKPVKLKGVCIHHDAGSLGAAVPKRAWQRRLQVLKSIGCNAIRTSHNPPTPALLDLCDRLGFVVIDEAFDKWGAPYVRSFPQWGRQDLTDMIRRDRNHPCVVMWSVGNEVREQGSPDCMRQLRQLVEWTRAADPTRPVTIALNPSASKSHPERVNIVMKMAGAVDVIALNYQEQWFDDYRKEDPDIRMFSGESYPYYRGKGDTHKAFYPVNPWLDAANRDYVAGAFYWTGIDYLGEAVAGCPFHGWNCSLIDTCGRVRPVGYLVKSFWADEPMVHIAVMDDALDVPKPTKDHWGWPKMVSHWTVPQCEGRKVKVATFSNCPAVELLVNGESMGVKELADFPDKMITWMVPCEPGTIEARGMADGVIKTSHRLKTAGEASQIRLSADRPKIMADGSDLCYVDVTITDDDGNRVPSADPELHFGIEGAGRIVGVDNGDLTSMESYKADKRSAYYGRAQVIIQSTRSPGTIQLTVRADGLPDARIDLQTVAESQPGNRHK